MITWYNTSICFCLFWHSYFYFFSERFTIGKKFVFYLVKRIASCLKWHHLDYDLVLRQCVCVYTHRCVCMCMRVCVYVCVCVCVIQCCKVTVPRNVHYFDHMRLSWQMGCGEESNCWTWRPSLTELWTYAREGTCNCFFSFRVQHHHSSPQSVQLCWLVVGLKAVFMETLVLLKVILWKQKARFVHAQGSGMADCLRHWTQDVELTGSDPSLGHQVLSSVGLCCCFLSSESSVFFVHRVLLSEKNMFLSYWCQVMSSVGLCFLCPQ